MNNRLAVGLAVGAGYLLGRTKKAKLALAVGTMVMGRKLELSPQALAKFASSQLQQNPQFKEIGDQLREDLRGVGHAATGALVNRQLSGLADRLHDRTLGVRDRAAGLLPGGDEDEDRTRGKHDERDDPRDEDDVDDSSWSEEDEASEDEASERDTRAAKKEPSRRTAQKTASAPRKTTAKKAAPKKAAAKKTTATGKKAGSSAGRGAPRKASGSRGGRTRG